MKKILSLSLLLCLCFSAFAVDLPDTEIVNEGLQEFVTGLADSVPAASTMSNLWSDAYVGQLLGIPPHFGVGASAGAAKMDISGIKKAAKDVLIDMPIVILVNENTASSSEILAGALKDLEEATIVGTTTYGKGVIQQLLTLKNGGGLKVTVQEYYTPKKNKINGIGIEPNVIVELPEGIENHYNIEKSQDTQLQKAIEILKYEEFKNEIKSSK